MLTYEPDDTVAHALDPRSKLAFQVGFAVAVAGHRSPAALATLTAIAVGALAAGRLSPIRVLRAYWFVLLLLALAPLFAAVVPRPPWVVPARAGESVLSGYRVVLVLFVAGVYVRSTPVRDSRAAIQRHLPGRAGQLLGTGVALVFRFFPVLLADLKRARMAIHARGGERRSAIDRARRVAVVGLRRAFERSDRLALALRARCFAWNPTLPALAFSGADYPVAVLGIALALSPLV